MSDTIIKVEGLGKKYTISHEQQQGYTALRDVISNKIKGLTKTKKSNFVVKEDFWALKDVNFEIKQGDAVGIIGRNGAGKSTLLKILSRITEPTHGRIELNGRVASLLEVGTGFHPELTGRENIFLNGAILGMSRVEIKRKFDEIVDFSGVEKFLDTPVKRYSSGMYVRLAFAVAAHLEPEILIVDEVLAVGDAEFQKKCLGKMDQVSKGEGRTVLFVSHNMGMINQLCTKCMLLNRGNMLNMRDTEAIINQYIQTKNTIGNSHEYEIDNSKLIGQLMSIKSINNNKQISDSFFFDENISIEIELMIKSYIPGLQIGIGLQDKFETRVCTFVREIENIRATKSIRVILKLPSNLVAPNSYSFVVALWNKNGAVYDLKEGVCSIHIVDNGSELALYEGNNYGSVILNGSWSVTS